MDVVCVNEPCENFGIVVPLTVTLGPGEQVACGGWVGEGAEAVPCGQWCEIRE